jgi:hypothetical protein
MYASDKFTSFLSDFCWNKNKNKPKQPLLYSLFQDSERTSTSTETNNTSYESPNIQLFGARRMRAWHYHGGATPTSLKSVCYFFFSEVMEAKRVNFFKKKIDYVICPHLMYVQISFL